MDLCQLGGNVLIEIGIAPLSLAALRARDKELIARLPMRSMSDLEVTSQKMVTALERRGAFS